MTFGSRFAGMGDPLGGGMPLYRYLGNRLTTVAQNLCLGTRFTDMHSGMRAYTRRALGVPPVPRLPRRLLLRRRAARRRRDRRACASSRSRSRRSYFEESSSISIPRSLEYVTHGTGSRRAGAGSRPPRRSLPAGVATPGPRVAPGPIGGRVDASVRQRTHGAAPPIERRRATSRRRSSAARRRPSASTTTSTSAPAAGSSPRRPRSRPRRSSRATRRSSTRST